MERRFGSFFYRNKAKEPEPSRRKRGVIPAIGRFVKKTCFFVGALVLFSIFMGLFVGIMLGGTSSSSLPKNMILTLDINDPVGESEHARSLTDPLASMGMTVGDIIASLDRASKDERVKGVIVRLNNAGMELSHIQELRTAIKTFRKSGKSAYFYTSSFADLGSGIGAYYLASAFDQIWMQPAGYVSVTGISIDMPFAKEALDKLGARAEFLHREEYKSAMESFTNSQMSPANREMMTSILNDLSAQIFKEIADDRGMSAPALQAQIDRGLIPGDAALKANLITRLDYDDELLKEARKNEKDAATSSRGLKKTATVELADYFDAMIDPGKTVHAPNVALVRISGEIVSGDEAEPGLAPGGYIAKAIDEAADDPGIEVIVLRIDSPGGSPTASETIRRAVIEAKKKEKKILVSMGPLAASGGYWIAVDADRIFAMPSTLTGSIGVIMGKFELSGLWDKLGINWDSLSWGKNAQLWSMNRPLNDHELATLNAAIDDTYGEFVHRVAQGRGMKDADVRKIAKGRAWTGLQAKDIGLVDEIGGLDVAMDHAAKLAGLKNRDDMKIIELPEPLSPLEQIMQLMGRSSVTQNFEDGSRAGAAVTSILRRAQIMDRIGPVQTYDPRFTIRP